MKKTILFALIVAIVTHSATAQIEMVKIDGDSSIKTFYIGKYEVTQKQWREVMGGGDPSYFKNCDDCPVEQISWDDVQEFIKKLNQQTGRKYRLPTEAEWNFAAKPQNGADGTAWYKQNSGGKTHPAGQKKPNALGLYDMFGNVWEWCQSDYYPGHGREERVMMGGAYNTEMPSVSNRTAYARKVARRTVGFRLAE